MGHKETLTIKEKIDLKNTKLDFKLKKLCFKKMKRYVTNWKKKSSTYASDKRLVSRVHEEHLKLIIKKANNTFFKKWVRDLNWHFPRQNSQVVNKQLKNIQRP